MENPRLSKEQIRNRLVQLFGDEEGVLTLLVGALLISDFDDPKEAFEEGLKALNGNRSYFNHLIQSIPGRLAASQE